MASPPGVKVASQSTLARTGDAPGLGAVSNAAAAVRDPTIRQAAKRIVSPSAAAPTSAPTQNDSALTLVSACQFVDWAGRLKPGQTSRAPLESAYGFGKRTADVTRNGDGTFTVRVYNRALGAKETPSPVNYYEFQAATAEEAARKLGLR